MKKNRDMMKKHIPIELVEALMLRLPVKSIKRLMRVSKAWYNLIKTSNFIKTHLDRSELNYDYHLLVSSQRKETVEFHTVGLRALLDGSDKRLQFKVVPTEDSHTEFVGSCNGVVCVRDYKGKRYTLYNPCTQTRLVLPDLNLVTDLKECYFADGFGYDCIGDDYKVVKLVRLGEIDLVRPSPIKVMVYSRRNKQWSEKQEILHDIIYTKTATRCNNRLYWIISVRLIACFDLNDEKFTCIKFPVPAQSPKQLANLQGVIHVVTYNFRLRSPPFVWKIKGDDWTKESSWSKVCSLIVPESEWPWSQDCKPIGYLRGGAQLLMCLNATLRYNPYYKHKDHAEPNDRLSLWVVDTSTSHIEPLPHVPAPINALYTHLYIESTVNLDINSDDSINY